YSTVLMKAQSLSRSREDPIEHGKLKPVSLLQRIKARLNSTELRFGCGHTLPRRIPSLNHIGGPVYSDKLAQFLAATVRPENDLQLLLHHLHLELPSQPPPRVTAALPAIMSGASP